MHSSSTLAVPCDCAFRTSAPAHHDRLLQIESASFDVLRELIDLVATWGEVEFGYRQPLIEPDDWMRFVEQHEWKQPDAVSELMLSLWSMTLARGRQLSTASGLRRAASVTSIEQAPSARLAGRTA